MPHNYAPLNSGVEGTALAHTLVGELATAQTQRSNGVGENVQQATGFSTAPYKTDRQRQQENNPRGLLCKANDDTCRGTRMTGEDFCVGHMRSLGRLDKTWNNKGEVTHFDEEGD